MIAMKTTGAEDLSLWENNKLVFIESKQK